MLRARDPPERGDDRKTVEIGHLIVDQEQIERPGVRVADDGETCGSAAYLGYLHAPTHEHAAENPPIHRVVVDQQNALSAELVRLLRRVVPDADAERQGDMEGTALAECALHPDAPTHQGGQPSGDRQTQTGAAETTRDRSVLLREGIEDACLVLR